jgi:DNA-binding transcriptional LysR family regulator
MPQRHRLSHRAVLDVSELTDEPLLRLNAGFASHQWFAAACQVAHVRLRVLVESGVPQTLIALARAGHGIALVPSAVQCPRAGIGVAVVTHNGLSIGRWAVAAWDVKRAFPRYAAQFVEELEIQCRRNYPGRLYFRRAPPLPRPRERA